MGIPSYFSYIVQNYKSIYAHLKNIHRDTLYMDCNSIIYDCLRNTTHIPTKEFNDIVFETKIIYEICEKIKDYINIVDPKYIVCIAFDGVAPVAKLEQQRTRRYKSHILKILEKMSVIESVEKNKNTAEIVDTSIQEYMDKLNTTTWNQTAITPGTQFMERLNKMVDEYFTNSKNRKPGVQYIISGSDKPGEGEHKLFHFIRTNKEFHKNKSTLIYGLDADLIMLSLNHIPFSRNIYLFREIPDYDDELKEIYGKESLCILNIQELSNHIMDAMIPQQSKNTFYKMSQRNIDTNIKTRINTKTKTKTKTNTKGRIFTHSHTMEKIYDYIFISFLLGNDFLPHHASLNIRTHGIDTLLGTYSQTISVNECIYDGKKINWGQFRKLILALAEMEEKNMKHEYSIMNKQGKKYIQANTLENIQYKMNVLPAYNRATEEYIDPYSKGWNERYYETLFHMNYDKGKIKQICLHYIEGLEWTMKYYTHGCKNYSWFYKYNYPPLFTDLVHSIPLFDCEFIKEDFRCIHPYTQLSYVLPESALSLLPKKIQEHLHRHYGNNYEQHPIVWTFCKYLWESHIEFPYMDIYQLENDIQNLLQ